MRAAERSPARDVSRWRFGAGHVLDESTLELQVAGERVELERKPLEMLMWLLRHPGEVVTKDELFDALWTGRVVSESVLTTCVGKLRQALGDESHAIVKTVHGFGYRLTAPVERLEMKAEADAPATRFEPGSTPPLRPNWRLLRRLPESRGENWLAEHAKTGERRVLKFAFDGPQLAQLKREITVNRLLRESLGGRDDIVRVLDWNIEQPPYFVELEYCAQGNLADWLHGQGGAASLALDDRLELAAQIADALAAAHSAGVLHKDVKPANVLVVQGDGGAPRARLADFGSARLLDAERLRAAAITRMGFTETLDADDPLSGTWAYLAPEILAGQPPTVRSDLYSLGVLLYQLIVGDLRRSLAPGWERDVDDPFLRDDVGRCCDVEPARRLGDASELARRLRSLPQRRADAAEARRRADEAAGLQAALARTRGRRRRATAVAAVALIALAATLVAFVQVRGARGLAEAQAAAARSVNDYLVRDLLGAANPMAPVLDDAAGGTSAAASAAPRSPDQLPVRALLDRAALRAGERFAGQPALESAVRMSLGEAYSGLSAYPQAAAQFLLAASGASASVPVDAARVAEALTQAVLQLAETDAPSGATQRFADARRAVAALPASLESERLGLSIDQAEAWLFYKEGRLDAALERLQAQLPLMERAWGARSAAVAVSLDRLSNVQLAAGRSKAAIETARRALDLRREVDGPAHPRLVETQLSLAQALSEAGELDAAEREARAARELGGRSLGRDHRVTLAAAGIVAGVARLQGRHDQAIAIWEDVVARRSQRYGETDDEAATFLNNLGLAYADAGRLGEAVPMLERAVKVTRALHGEAHPETISAEHNLADVLADAGRWDESLAIERRILPLARQALGPQSPSVGLMLRTTGRVLLHQHKVDEARRLLEEARAVIVAGLGERHPNVGRVDELLAQAEKARPDAPAPRSAPAR